MQMILKTVMSIKETYLSIFFLLVVSPALILFAPNILTYFLVGALALIYLFFHFTKPRRRCSPCGEIITLSPFSFVKLLRNRLECRRCGTTLKNRDRI